MSLESLKLANIQNLHNTIDSTTRIGIKQKGELVKDLNTKKYSLINSIESTLNLCRNTERTIYNKLSNRGNVDAYNRLEEYNVYLKEQHDRGSDLIGRINAAKNFQELNTVEMNMVNPFLTSLRNNCGVYSRSSSLMNTSLINTDGSTEIRTAGLGKTDINVQHSSRGVDVDVVKEERGLSPAHSVHVSSSKGPVKVIHQPSPQPVRRISTIQPTTLVHPVTRVVQPVQTVAVYPSPVRVIQPVQHVVPVQPVTRVVPAQPVRTVAVSPAPVRVIRPVQHVVPVQPVRTVAVSPVPVRVIRPVQHVVPVQPVTRLVRPVRTVAVSPVPVRTVVVTTPILASNRAVVTHDYQPTKPGNKLALRKGTSVTVEKYSGDWAHVRTSTGQRGWISRFYLRSL